jgi:hypothetical protein
MITERKNPPGTPKKKWNPSTGKQEEVVLEFPILKRSSEKHYSAIFCTLYIYIQTHQYRWTQ